MYRGSTSSILLRGVVREGRFRVVGLGFFHAPQFALGSTDGRHPPPLVTKRGLGVHDVRRTAWWRSRRPTAPTLGGPPRRFGSRSTTRLLEGPLRLGLASREKKKPTTCCPPRNRSGEATRTRQERAERETSPRRLACGIASGRSLARRRAWTGLVQVFDGGHPPPRRLVLYGIFTPLMRPSIG